MFMSTIFPMVMLVVFLGVPMTPLFIFMHQLMHEDDDRKGAHNN